MQNLFPHERHFRIFIGIAVLIYGVYASIWFTIPIGIVLIYTGAVNFCPLFFTLGINSKTAKLRFNISQLPDNNPEPVFLFDDIGTLVFRNTAAERVLPQLSDIDAFKRHNDLIEVETSKDLSSVTVGEQSFLLHYKKLGETGLTAAYGFNVSELRNANNEVIDTQKELLYRMGEIGESRSNETGSHVKRVAEYSYLLAKLAGLSEAEAITLKAASPMHDIGKVAIPDSILLKPGKLSDEEREQIKTHASIGYNLLKGSDRPVIQAAAIVAGQHHEKWNGMGYPAQLKAEKIHIFGRITAIADVFDALGSDRVYKKAWPLEDIVALLKEEQGQHFDPHLIDIFLSNLGEFLVIRDKYKDNLTQE